MQTKGEQLTVVFEVYAQGEMTTGILETLELNIQNGYWIAFNPEADAPLAWRGRGEYQKEAILDYLKKRLGIGLERDPLETQ